MPPGLGKQDRARAELVMEWFNAMADADEKALLKPTKPGHAISSDGDRRRTAVRLHKLVVARLTEGFGDAVPRELGKGNLSATALENRVRALKVKIVPTAAAFAEWRKAHEAADAHEAAAAAPATPSPSKKRKGT